MRRLEACYFVPSTSEADVWRRLVSVLARSAATWCPDWAIRILELPVPAPRPGSRADSYLANTYKLEAWIEAVDGADNGDELVLLDADMMITGPLDAIWDRPFDIAYTTRQDCPVPLNGGVVFMRVSPASRRWAALWLEENAAMFRSADEYAPWRRRYQGLNQAALGKMLETRAADHGASVLAVPCATWNCENTAWASFDPQTTRIVHVKDVLRNAVLGQGPMPPGCSAVVDLWRRLDRQAQEAS